MARLSLDITRAESVVTDEFVAVAALAASTAVATPPSSSSGAPQISNTAPWVAGTFYSVVPRGELQPIHDKGEKWYAVTRGKWVGVTNNTALAVNATTGRSAGFQKGYDNQSLALSAFNTALAMEAILVI
ncbi:unnamed protein product [Mycena citricolor]|uniref:Uncharacterized protein n=1 Tax=Mycena citricolor TaxID=2018698 RepID=A0AAD2I0D7_9AGAR|nr:unnamed protein product [Mycena citricolor]